MPELLNIHHGFNFRDLGGYQTKAGQTVRYHKLIRSGRLSALSDRDQQYLADYAYVTMSISVRHKNKVINLIAYLMVSPIILNQSLPPMKPKPRSKLKNCGARHWLKIRLVAFATWSIPMLTL